MVDLRKRYGHKIITLDQITKVTSGMDNHLVIPHEPRETVAP
jgi:hypothetical protein